MDRPLSQFHSLLQVILFYSIALSLSLYIYIYIYILLQLLFVSHSTNILFLGCRKRAESDPTVPDAPVRAEKFAQRYPFLALFLLIIYVSIPLYLFIV